MTHQGSETDNKIWRESSYKFWGRCGQEEFDFPRQGKTEEAEEDPPTRLIGQFLHRQKASGDFSLDIDLEMQELREEIEPSLPTVAEESPSPSPLNGRPSKASKVSFDEELRNGNGGGGGGDDDRVVKCTSNASLRSSDSFKRKSRVLIPKSNKSRLLDPPQSDQQQSETRSTRSGMLTRQMDDEDVDDPFSGEDLPEEYKKAKVDLLVVLEWVSLILLVGALVCSLVVPYLKEKTLWKLKLWTWEVMVLVLICGRLMSSWVIRVIVFFIERNFLLRKRVLYFIYGLRKAVQNCLWLGQVLVAWHFLFKKKVAQETGFRTVYYITKVLVCLIVGTLIWLVKTLVVKVLASSFHVSTYFDRIQESLFNQYVIETLCGPPLVEIRRAEEEVVNNKNEVEKLKKAGASVPSEIGSVLMSAKGSGRNVKSPLRGTGKGKDGITVDHLHKLSPKNVSAWNMKRLINLVRHGHLTTRDEQITSRDEPCTPISSESEAKVAAKKILLNVAQQGSRYIFIEDLMRFMVEDEAMKTMSLFEGAPENHMISKSSLKTWVVKAFRERRALALSLDDTKKAVNKLHHMVNTLVSIVVLIIWLQILGIATKKLLLLVTSQLLLVVFIFGNSCKNTFESIIFLFVMHPFDVGDRCEVDGVEMVVEEMNILTTVFLRSDNLKIVIPNSVLATKAISNYYRSPNMGDAVEFSVHISVPAEKLAIMKQRITSYIEGKKEHWHPAPMIIIKDVEDLTRLRIAVWLRHRMNHQDMGEKWARRALLVEEMVKIFMELDIQYRLLPLDVNIRTGPSSWHVQSGYEHNIH